MGLMKSNEQGEIVQVQGGHIVRSTGRKDRHSKVYTAKGPRDRRVRLSAHTAIQFYDVQDRLGYDRPSKAVDWLIKKAKSAIDKLAELPPCFPNTTDADPNELGIGADQSVSESSGYNFQLHQHLDENPDDNSNFMPPPLDSVAIEDTMKSFFPTNSAASSINFQSYPSDLISRTANPTQDLGLSLHTFQDPGCLNSTPGGFEANYQRMVAWNNDRGTEHGGGFVFSSLPFLGQGGASFSQRGPLQSSFAPSLSVCAWNDLSIASAKDQKAHSVHHSPLFGTRFTSDGLQNGFCIPGEEDENGIVSGRLSSPSPNSHH